MVLLEELGLRVEDLVYNSAAEEFHAPAQPDAEDEDPKSPPFMRQRYIESKADMEFAISCELLDKHGSLKPWVEASKKNVVFVIVSIDGYPCGAGGFLNYRRGKDSILGITDRTNNTIQKFQFAAISLVEDASTDLQAVHKKQIKDLGTIQVRCYRAIVTKGAEKRENDSKQSVSANGTRAVRGLAQGDELTLTEKALKGRALMHRASLAPVSHLPPVRATSRVSTRSRGTKKLVDPLDNPIANLKFMYRSKDALKQELIIPRTPSPETSRSPEPQTVVDLSPDEIRRLAQDRLPELRGRKRATRIKKEEDEATQPTRPLKYARISGGRQAIDLTEDD